MPETPLRIQGLTGAEESPYGTDATPANTAGIRGVGFLWGAVEPSYLFENLREDALSNSLVKAIPGTPAGRVVQFTYDVEIKGSGAAYSSSTPVRPEMDPLLRACGMSRTHVDTGGSETVSYALADTGHVGVTFYVYAGAKIFRLVGCRGTFTLTAPAGRIATMRFVIQGMLITTPIQAAVPSITYSSVRPPATVAASLALVPNGSASWSPAWPTLEVDIGNNVVPLEDGSAADGLEGYFINARAPRFRFTPRTVDLSAYSAYALAASRLDHTIDATIGQAQYNRMDIDIGDARLMTVPTNEADNDFPAWSAEYELQDLVLRFD